MEERFFIDTGIITAAFIKDNETIRDRAHKILSSALVDHTGVLSDQVLTEFFAQALSDFQTPMTIKDARLFMDRVLLPLCEIHPTADLFKHALRITEEEKLSFRDACIVAAALQGNCKVIFSEALPHGIRYEGLVFHNPFSNLED